MMRERCAWLGKDGICKDERNADKYGRRFECKKLRYCDSAITNRAMSAKLTQTANDREVTPLTRRLVKMYHDEGDTVNQIAFVLQRSPKAIKKILEEC